MCVCVRVIACVYLCVKQENEKGRANDKERQRNVETSVERAPGQKAESQSTKMTTLEYESRSSGTPGS